MDFFTVLIAGFLSAVAYILGYRQRDHENRNNQPLPSTSSSNYKKINENPQEQPVHGDEESLAEQAKRSQRRSDTTVEAQREELIKDQQKELDRLMRELTECKKREQKSNAEIQYLKAKVTQQPISNTQSKQSASYHPVELISDQGFTDLLDEASQHCDIDEDELSKQIDAHLF